jgi:integrase
MADQAYACASGIILIVVLIVNQWKHRMSRTLHRLKAVAVAQMTKPGLYSDGGGLYLQITPAGVRSWLFRYMRNGKARGMGLGPLHTISLAKARTKAHECREKLLEGTDPLDAKKKAEQEQRIEDAKALSFRDCATNYHLAHKDGWKNKKHADQWANTLATYAYPVIGDLPIAAVDVGLVMKILEPIWRTKTETASRLRGRIESVIDWSTARGFRSGENPARWKGHLDHLLMSRSAANKVVHHPALPYAEVAVFIADVRKQEGFAKHALELLILTASRTSEILNATWDELDLELGIWTIPAERMKAAREHRVPLSDRACEILRTQLSIRQGQQRTAHADYVFPGRKASQCLSNMSMLQLLKRMNRSDLTVHGFRSTFRDWAGECTSHAREIAEAALAHTVKDKTEAAYARGDLFEKRRVLMSEWAAFCTSKSDR